MFLTCSSVAPGAGRGEFEWACILRLAIANRPAPAEHAQQRSAATGLVPARMIAAAANNTAAMPSPVRHTRRGLAPDSQAEGTSKKPDPEDQQVFSMPLARAPCR